MNKYTNTILTFAITLFYVVSAHGYEPKTHSDLSESALRKSALVVAPAKLAQLGLKPSIETSGDKFPNSKGQTGQSIIELIRFGADWEDNLGLLQAPRHFYNPVDGSKLLRGIDEIVAEYFVNQKEEITDRKLGLFVYFVKDGDGAWRISTL